MSVYLTQNPVNPGSGNTARPGDTQFKFYEKTYSTVAAQEWIYMPDTINNVMSLTVVTTGGSSAVEVTCSPPDIVEAGTAVVIDCGTGAIASTSKLITLNVVTAFRVNVASGSAKLSVMV